MIEKDKSVDEPRTNIALTAAREYLQLKFMSALTSIVNASFWNIWKSFEYRAGDKLFHRLFWEWTNSYPSSGDRDYYSFNPENIFNLEILKLQYPKTREYIQWFLIFVTNTKRLY